MRCLLVEILESTVQSKAYGLCGESHIRHRVKIQAVATLFCHF
jgi:hypothetical protein